jgi:hypothetical protein
MTPGRSESGAPLVEVSKHDESATAWTTAVIPFLASEIMP